jgi:hypothetical protein
MEFATNRKIVLTDTQSLKMKRGESLVHTTIEGFASLVLRVLITRMIFRNFVLTICLDSVLMDQTVYLPTLSFQLLIKTWNYPSWQIFHQRKSGVIVKPSLFRNSFLDSQNKTSFAIDAVKRVTSLLTVRKRKSQRMNWNLLCSRIPCTSRILRTKLAFYANKRDITLRFVRIERLTRAKRLVLQDCLQRWVEKTASRRS